MQIKTKYPITFKYLDKIISDIQRISPMPIDTIHIVEALKETRAYGIFNVILNGYFSKNTIRKQEQSKIILDSIIFYLMDKLETTDSDIIETQIVFLFENFVENLSKNIQKITTIEEADLLII